MGLKKLVSIPSFLPPNTMAPNNTSQKKGLRTRLRSMVARHQDAEMAGERPKTRQKRKGAKGQQRKAARKAQPPTSETYKELRSCGSFIGLVNIASTDEILDSNVL